MLTPKRRSVLNASERILFSLSRSAAWIKLAGARLRIRELEEKLAISATEWKSVNLKSTEQQQRIDTLTEELRELDAQLGVCERDYEAMCETASREIERKNKAIEAAELYRSTGGTFMPGAWDEPNRLLAEAKGETP